MNGIEPEVALLEGTSAVEMIPLPEGDTDTGIAPYCFGIGVLGLTPVT